MIAWNRAGLNRLCSFLLEERRKRGLGNTPLLRQSAIELIERIWRRTRINGNCIETLNSPKQRYAYVRVTGDKDYVDVSITRTMYILYNGKLKHLACHSCDNTHCVNPKHLWQGTHTDNLIDAIRKGRTNNPRGEKRPNHVLTEKIVRDIKILRRDKKWGYKKIAKLLGFSPATVRNVLNERNWNWVKI